MKSHLLRNGAVCLIAWCLLCVCGIAAAEKSDKPFAERYYVLQISDDDPAKQTLVLNVANNILKHYGPDKVDVEIVAFGPGLRLLFDGNVNADRISGLADNGVRFSACLNTFSNMSRVLGRELELDPHAVKVSAGVVRIGDLVSDGYILVKP